MISAEVYTKVLFDKDGEEKIVNAIETMQEIIDALQKIGGFTDDVEESLKDAVSHMREIIDGTLW